jgi:hypothetical protein
MKNVLAHAVRNDHRVLVAVIESIFVHDSKAVKSRWRHVDDKLPAGHHKLAAQMAGQKRML